MSSVVAMALFCESIRQETAGSETIVGIMPDNVNVPQVPSIIPRLSLYVGLQIDPNSDPNPVTISFFTPQGNEERIMEVDAATVNEARESAKIHKKPLAGIVCRVDMAPFHVPTLGRLEVIVQTAEERLIAGAVTFVTPDTKQALAE